MSKYLKLVTPAGTARYPWLTKPDTHHNPDGVYKTDLLLSSKEAKPLADQIKKFFQETYPDKKGKMPYSKELDKDEKETGNIIFKFKTKTNKPALFDASGKPVQNVNVFAGSKIKVSSSAAVYNAGGNIGVTLYLNQVQIIELVTGDSNGQQAFAFEPVEGYQHTEEVEQSFNTETETAVVDDDDF